MATESHVNSTPGFKIRLTYQEISALFQKKSCLLLTTEEEYDEKHLDKSSYYTFLASCGHERTTTLHNMRRSEVWICKSCSTSQMADKKRGNSGKKYDQEDGSFKYIANLLSDKFDIVKSSDGVKVDMLVKPKKIADDLWLQIQLKSTLRARPNTSQYVFSINGNSYDNMLLVCVCVVDDKIWVMDGNDLPNMILNITDKQESKYEQYSVTPIIFTQLIYSIYSENLYNPISCFDAQQLVNKHYLISNKFRTLREQYCAFLKFVYPDKSNQVYDFTINGYKIQEKACDSYNNDKKYVVLSMTKSNYGNGTKCRPYDQGDNDYYWYHHPDKNTFWIIPENTLIEQGIISTANNKGKGSLLLYSHGNLIEQKNKKFKSFWACEYRYQYENLDRQSLSDCFKKDDISS